MTQKKWAIQEILNVTAEFFRHKGIESPRLCAEVLLAHELKESRVELYLAFDQPLTSDEIAGYRSLIKRRLKREPLLLGDSGQPKVLDLGTGSGAIAISLAKEIEGAAIWASDISFEALTVARNNAKHHNLNSRIEFCQGDLWQPFSGSPIAFDIIISNPPYILSKAFETLPPEVRDYEPRVALDGRENGMRFIERIIEESGIYLKSGGWLLIEMDPDQTEKALYLIDSTQSFGYKERLMDYRKKYRLIKAQKKNG